jgi:hypothetical protein
MAQFFRQTRLVFKYIIYGGQSVQGVGFGRFDAAIAGLNCAKVMDVCPRISVLCRPL